MDYIHGYSERETERLGDQSCILDELLHSDIAYAPGTRLLEAGCGVGAQTRILVRRHPGVKITSVDKSAESLKTAASIVDGEAEMGCVTFLERDVLATGFPDASFDHVFVCFVLEHIDEPVKALLELRRVLKPGGSITVIEGDHGSCFWYPERQGSRFVWEAFVDSQKRLGHDPLIGRRLCQLLLESGFAVKKVEPRSVYADAMNPGLLDGVVNRIIVPMVETGREKVLDTGVMTEDEWRSGIEALGAPAGTPAGSFFYSWFRGVGVVEESL